MFNYLGGGRLGWKNWLAVSPPPLKDCIAAKQGSDLLALGINCQNTKPTRAKPLSPRKRRSAFWPKIGKAVPGHLEKPRIDLPLKEKEEEEEEEEEEA